MAIFRPKSTGISLFQFSYTELRLVGLLPAIALVHLLVHARWWGQLARLGWARDRRDKYTFILSQYFLIPAAIAVAAWAGVHNVHYHPRPLHT